MPIRSAEVEEAGGLRLALGIMVSLCSFDVD